jgi:imidazolonepropionase-like amidohydrolase
MMRLAAGVAVALIVEFVLPAAAAQGVTVIRAGRLVDTDKGEIRPDQLVFVRGERIESVHPGSARIPSGAKVIDLRRYTVTPGLIDCHAHLVGDISGHPLIPLERSGAQEAFSGVRNARSTLLAGFTTVRDIGTYRAFVDAALRDAINEGTVIGPRMAVAGAYVTVSTGAGEVTGMAPDVTLPPDYRFGVANSVAEVRQKVRALLNGGADFIKILATGAVLTRGTKPGVSEYTEEEIKAAVDQAAQYGTFVAAHAHGAEGIKNAVRAGVRSIEHGSLMDDEAIALMKERGTYLVSAGVADPERLGVGGWSYGGILTNQVIARDQRFKAAISGSGQSNAFTGYGTDQYVREYESELGTPWGNPDAYRRVSFPFFHADRIVTPTLFLCGEKDFNVPVLNSEQMYQALRSLGRETELIIYPGEYHEIRTPSYRVDRQRRYLEWYHRYLNRQGEAASRR